MEYVSCGEIITKMNSFIPELTHLAILIIKIGTPVILIILGMIDMFKAMTAQKEDEIKKAQSLFIKRLIAGVLVYLVFIFVELVFNVLADAVGPNKDNIWSCVECFMDGPDSCK